MKGYVQQSDEKAFEAEITPVSPLSSESGVASPIDDSPNPATAAESNALYPNELELGLRKLGLGLGMAKSRNSPRLDVLFQRLIQKRETSSSHELNINFVLQ